MSIICKTSCQLVEVPDNWKRAADEKTGYVNEERVVNLIYVVSGNIFDTITHSILIFKLRKYGMHECGLKNGSTARVEVWLNIQLKASNKWSATVVQYCSMSLSMIWMMRPGACTLQQIQDDAQ